MDVELISIGEPHLRALQYGGANTVDEELFTVVQDNNRVIVRTKRFYKLFSIGFGVNERLVIKIPDICLGDISIKVSSGNIHINDAFTWQNVSLASSSGVLLAGGGVNSKQ